MAQYHGDLNQFGDSIFQSRQDKSYIIAILLAFFLGFTGIHRFYFGPKTFGMAHLGAFFLALMVMLASIKVAVLILTVQSLILLVEIVWLMVQFLNERTG